MTQEKLIPVGEEGKLPRPRRRRSPVEGRGSLAPHVSGGERFISCPGVGGSKLSAHTGGGTSEDTVPDRRANGSRY